MSQTPQHRLIGAVLAGGASRRFGSNKALAPVPGGTLGARSVQALRDAGVDPVVAVGGIDSHLLHIPVIPDRKPDLGPLGGIASVLVWAKTGHVLVLPCDLPLVVGAHLGGFVDWVADADPSRAAVATVVGSPQPIVAAWPASFGPLLAREVAAGRRRLFEVLDLVDWDPIDVPAELLADADTSADLERLLGADPNNQ